MQPKEDKLLAGEAQWKTRTKIRSRTDHRTQKTQAQNVAECHTSDLTRCNLEVTRGISLAGSSLRNLSMMWGQGWDKISLVVYARVSSISHGDLGACLVPGGRRRLLLLGKGVETARRKRTVWYFDDTGSKERIRFFARKEDRKDEGIDEREDAESLKARASTCSRSPDSRVLPAPTAREANFCDKRVF